SGQSMPLKRIRSGRLLCRTSIVSSSRTETTEPEKSAMARDRLSTHNRRRQSTEIAHKQMPGILPVNLLAPACFPKYSNSLIATKNCESYPALFHGRNQSGLECSGLMLINQPPTSSSGHLFPAFCFYGKHNPTCHTFLPVSLCASVCALPC